LVTVARRTCALGLRALHGYESKRAQTGMFFAPLGLSSYWQGNGMTAEAKFPIATFGDRLRPAFVQHGLLRRAGHALKYVN
jgi:hypothetical protein